MTVRDHGLGTKVGTADTPFPEPPRIEVVSQYTVPFPAGA